MADMEISLWYEKFMSYIKNLKIENDKDLIIHHCYCSIGFFSFKIEQFSCYRNTECEEIFCDKCKPWLEKYRSINLFTRELIEEGGEPQNKYFNDRLSNKILLDEIEFNLKDCEEKLNKDYTCVGKHYKETDL